MSSATGQPTRLAILAAGDGEMVDRLRRVLPDADLAVTALSTLVGQTLSLHPRVVVCAAEDPARGLLALRQLRTARCDARLLFISSSEAVSERLGAIELGVDDVLTLPVSDAELRGRIELLRRRRRPAGPRRLSVGDGLELDLDRGELLRQGDWVHLRPKEAQLLELFARAPGRVMSRRHILDRVWGHGHVGDPRTVDVHVRWLRSKIEPDPQEPVRLLTVRGVGYRLEPSPLTER